VLNFYDARGHIEEGFVPTFNALNLFRVPAWHSVSQVAIFGGLRYSVTGWFHAAKKLDAPLR
jgi:Rps23 Pro-64 3,4-dihydroxylase Tpa1-like proline 4-hydroxylase